MRDVNRYFPWLKFVMAGFVILDTIFLVDALIPRQVKTVEAEPSLPIALSWSGKMERVRDLKNKKLIALTFDDGPGAETTPRLLDVLKAKQVKATFFELGSRMLIAPEVTKRAIREGHEVESHSVGHANLSALSNVAVRADYERMKEIFQEVIKREPKYLRPPYGAMSAQVRALPIVLMGWTVDSRDWESKDPAAILTEVKKASFDGAVILMHDIYETTVDAVAPTVDWLREQGYEFVTIEEMVEARGKELRPGILYGDFSG